MQFDSLLSRTSTIGISEINHMSLSNMTSLTESDDEESKVDIILEVNEAFMS